MTSHFLHAILSWECWGGGRIREGRDYFSKGQLMRIKSIVKSSFSDMKKVVLHKVAMQNEMVNQADTMQVIH